MIPAHLEFLFVALDALGLLGLLERAVIDVADCCEDL